MGAGNKKSAAHRGKSSKKAVVSKKSSAKPHSHARGSEAVTIDRRRSDRRTPAERKAAPAEPVSADKKHPLERRAKVNRRRQIDPTTCERDYTHEEIEFMSALDEYKRRNGRMFPTCSEILEVVRSIGYVKMPKVEQPASPAEATPLPAVEMPISATFAAEVTTC